MPSPAPAPARPHRRAAAAMDGRVVRGERTRRALAEALVSLIEEGQARPTARQVAERAGVSLRLVFHHFDDMEGVLRSAVAVQAERHWSRLRPIDAGLQRRQRVARLVHQRAELFEGISPVRRAAELVEHESPTVAAELDHARRELRAELAAVFAAELAEARSRRAELLDMLEVATSFECWAQLRGRLGRSPATARRVMARLVHCTLDTTPRPGGTP